LLVGLAAIVVLTIAAIVALPRLVDTPRVQALIASSASQALGRPVKFQSVSVSVLPYPAARLHTLEIAEDPAFGGGPFLKLDAADLRLKLWPLLRGHVEFATLVLKEPTIELIQVPDGRWNFGSLGTAREPAAVPRAPRAGGGAPAAPAMPVSRVVIDKGLVTYEARGRGDGGRADGGSRRRLENVGLTLSASPGALSFSGAARVMPGDLTVKISDGTLGLSGARTLADASVRAQIALDGKDVRAVVASALGPEPAISGALTGRLDVSGTVGRPHAAGEVELQSPTVTRTNPECAEPRRRTLPLSSVKANVTWDDGRLLVQPLATGIGSGSITAKLTATPTPPVPTELTDVVLRGIPLERVLVDFLCQGYAVSGPLDLAGRFTLTATDPLGTLAGTGQLRLGPGKVVGASALALLGGIVRVGATVSSALSLELPTSMFASPLDFESIVGTYQVHDGVVTTRDLLYTSRAMKVKVAGDYALLTGRVNFDVVVDDGRRQLQAKVTGPAASPAIRVAPAAILRQLEPEKVERSLKDLLKRFR
jgi:uncharacterized protein involved in outer membrane biogenesis